jgi:hypothetical protein
MENFSPRVAEQYPRAVDPADLYEGPDPKDIEQFSQPRFASASESKDSVRTRRDYVATITAALDMLGSRILALIAVVAACGIWSWSVYEPEPQRTYAAIAFSLTVFLPAVALYWRRG